MENLDMTKEEYIMRMESEEEEFVPDWDAIDSEFERLYSGIEQDHYATLFTARAI